MSIRKRLASFILLMTSLLVVMGGVLLLGGPIIVTSFRQSVESMNSLDLIRQLRSNVTRQRATLNRYLLVDDLQELIGFDEASRLSRQNVEEIQRHAGVHPPPWVPDLVSAFNDTQKTALQVKEHYRTGNKAKAFEEATSIFDKLFNRVSALEKEKADEAQKLVERIWLLTRWVEWAVLIGLAIAAIFGFVLFQSLYQSVMRPLEVLRKGAEEFGRGHWEHRINLPSANEFGALAGAFNKMADNVKQLQLQAVHMDRMSAVGQLAGGVAHEINNPLTAVLGQAQILLARLPEADVSYGQIQKIEQAALRCKKIVRGLLDFSRPSQSTFEQIDVTAILYATLDLCEADLKRSRVNVEKKFPKNLPLIEGNPSELQQVLLNLITNAIQAMPRGGGLTLEGSTHNEPLVISDRKGSPLRSVAGPWVEITLRDTGVGIVKEHLSRVFEPFFTTKEIGKGTGLGLAVSMGIVQKHGGDLRVESAGLNKGCTFFLVLPLKHAASGPASQDRRAGMAA